MRIFYVWFPNLFLQMIYASKNTIVLFTENAILANYIDRNHAIYETQRSLAQCGAICALHNACASFFHSNTTMKCITNSVNFNNVGNLLSPGTRYYNRQINHLTTGWPLGTYALPKPKTGCPINGQWQEGWVYQDTKRNTKWSTPANLSGTLDNAGIKLEYCVKTSEFATEQKTWPKGDYCILKKFDCPVGFNELLVYWDDEDTKNKNDKGGVLPDGKYTTETVIIFCCRRDGIANLPLQLPTESPFHLLSYINSVSYTDYLSFVSYLYVCPTVVGMHLSNQHVFFDNEKSKDFGLTYCYYYPK